jgi:hypothetical protein
MSHARLPLLQWLVTSSAANVSAQYPHGFCYVPGAQLVGVNELATDALVTAYPGQQQPDGSFPVMPTVAGVEMAKGNPVRNEGPVVAAVASAAPAAVANTGVPVVKLEDGIPMPAAARRGFQATGTSKVDQYPFATMNIGQTFHLPPSGDPDKAKATHRTFSSVVSQANKKFYPKNFSVREVGADDPMGPGARVWRLEDMIGERPTRARKAKPEAAPAAPAAPASTGWPAPGQEQGQGAGFAAPGAFAPPGGFAPPAAPAGGFGGPGFDPNAAPAVFAPTGPSFGQ